MPPDPSDQKIVASQAALGGADGKTSDKPEGGLAAQPAPSTGNTDAQKKKGHANERKFWPFQPRFSLVSVAIVLVGLLVAVAYLRSWLNWPTDQSETVVLIGILVLSLLPVALAILDIVIERGGTFEYGGVKIDFGKSRVQGTTGLTVPPNIGVRGRPISASATIEILGALRQATAAELVVVDLEDGQAWWETRLFVLIEGAMRLGRPDKFVFVGRDEGVDKTFQGWGYARDLMQPILRAHPQYARSLQSALAVVRQWDLVEPLDPEKASDRSVAPPAAPPSLVGRLAPISNGMAFDSNTGLRNDLFTEQLLQSDLGDKIEHKEGPRPICLNYLKTLFQPVLKKNRIDLTKTPEEQLDAFLGSDAAFLAITVGGVYSALVPRASLSNQVLRALVKRDVEAE